MSAAAILPAKKKLKFGNCRNSVRTPNAFTGQVDRLRASNYGYDLWLYLMI